MDQSDSWIFWTVIGGLTTLTFGRLWCVRLRQKLKDSEVELIRQDQERRQLESDRQRAVELNEANAAFFANISHELRTPFQGVLGMLELIHEGELDAQQRRQVDVARKSAHHLLGTLNEILDVSAMDAGTFNLVLQPFSIRKLVQDVADLMGPQASAQGLSLVTEVTESVPNWVNGDEFRVRQILFNLIGNAIKFTEHGRITVRLRNSRSLADGVVFTVTDTGPGMDAETIQKLFTRYFRGRSLNGMRVSGTGLGLEISRNLARLMKGDIHVQSTPGKGSIFAVTLVLPACAATVEVDIPELPPEIHASSKSLRLLVADDNPVNRQYMQLMLEKLGHAVTVCEDGPEALDEAKAQRFDALLLDYHMPTSNGLEVIQKLRAERGESATSPVIIITADPRTETRTHAINAGVKALLKKPVQRKELERTLSGISRLAPGRPDDAPYVAASAHTQGQSQFPLSNYEAPILLNSTPTDRHTDSELVDFSAITSALEFMSLSSLVEKLRTVTAQDREGLRQLIEALHSQDRERQRFALHKYKGAAMILGLQAMAAWAEDAMQTLSRAGNKALGPEWIDSLLEKNQHSRRLLLERFPEL